MGIFDRLKSKKDIKLREIEDIGDLTSDENHMSHTLAALPVQRCR
jgi:hypothetical protein